MEEQEKGTHDAIWARIATVPEIQGDVAPFSILLNAFVDGTANSIDELEYQRSLEQKIKALRSFICLRLSDDQRVLVPSKCPKAGQFPFEALANDPYVRQLCFDLLANSSDYVYRDHQRILAKEDLMSPRLGKVMEGPVAPAIHIELMDLLRLFDGTSERHLSRAQRLQDLLCMSRILPSLVYHYFEKVFCANRTFGRTKSRRFVLSVSALRLTAEELRQPIIRRIMLTIQQLVTKTAPMFFSRYIQTLEPSFPPISSNFMLQVPPDEVYYGTSDINHIIRKVTRYDARRSTNEARWEKKTGKQLCVHGAKWCGDGWGTPFHQSRTTKLFMERKLATIDPNEESRRISEVPWVFDSFVNLRKAKEWRYARSNMQACRFREPRIKDDR